MLRYKNMKKLLVLTFLGLAWCNVVFAKCVTGNCENGEGTYSWARNDLRGTEGWGGQDIGEWKNSKRHGKGTYKWRVSPKEEYVGEWKNNKMHGQGIYTWHKARQILIGEWIDGKRITANTAKRSVQLKQLVKMYEDGIVSKAQFDKTKIRVKNKSR